MCAERDFYVIRVQKRLERSHKHAEKNRASKYSANGEDGADKAEKPGEQAAPSAENGQDAADDGRECGPEADFVRDEHPLGDMLVCVQSLAATLAQDVILQLLRIILHRRLRALNRARNRAITGARGGGTASRSRAVQSPDRDGIEVVIRLPLRAVVNRAIGRVGRAVVPEVYLIYVRQRISGLCRFQGEGEVGGVVETAGGGDGEVREVDLEEVERCLCALLPSGYLDHGEADK